MVAAARPVRFGRQTHAAPAALAAATLGVLLSLTASAEADAESDRLRAENTRLEARVRELEAENARLRAHAGAAEAAADRSVTARVDAERAVTSLDVGPSRLELTSGNRSRHWIALHAERDASAAGTAVIEIEAAASNGAYRNVGELEISLDGARLALPVSARTATPILAGPQQQRIGERETVRVVVPTADVARIGSAREVRGRLGPTSFVLNAEQIAAFGAVARRLAAGEPGR